jgi:thiosulfate dehydrogenase [quinone] large subunit
MDSLEVELKADRQIAYSLMRAMLGMNIALHGISRIYSGVVHFAMGEVPLFVNTPLPPSLVYGYTVALPFAEALIGLAVLFGIGSRYAYIAGFLLMISLTFGSALHQDFGAAGVQLTYGFIYAILLAFREYNRFSIDASMKS